MNTLINWKLPKRIDNGKLASRIIDCISDGYDDEEIREETEDLLYDSLSQLDKNNPIKAALIKLCETIEEFES